MSTGRSYGGESADARRARRRRQLLDAGLEVFGTTGYRHATVRVLCRAARVTDRYFYEQFAGTEDLLVAVYAEGVDRLEDAATAAVADAGPAVRDLARVGLDAFLAVVEEDPRLARVVWFEVLGVSPQVEALYLGRMERFGGLLFDLLGDRLRADVDPGHRRIVSQAAVGGISHCVLSWTASDFATPRRELVEALAAFLDGVAGPFVSGSAPA